MNSLLGVKLEFNAYCFIRNSLTFDFANFFYSVTQFFTLRPTRGFLCDSLKVLFKTQ